jgi:GNAT superfamily N-acetyltransferase
MSDYELRRATSLDAATITGHRRAMFADMGYTDAARLDAMDAAFLPWVTAHLERGEYLGWLARDATGVVVAGAGLWIMEWPPHALGVDPRRGNILNVYVEPGHRRRGLARRLMQVVLDQCWTSGLEAVILHASEAGRPLYEALGFTPTNEMRRLLAEG